MLDIIDFEQVDEWLNEYLQIESPQEKEQLQNLITMTCLPLAKRVARSLARRSTDPIEDIIQIGTIGLIKAVRSYDPNISKNFKSYATYLITGEIRHYIRDKVSVMRPSRAIQELCYRVNKITVEMIDQLGEEPDEFEIAKKMDVNITDIQQFMGTDRRTTILSLDQLNLNCEDDYSNWGERIADISYDEMQAIKEDRLMLAQCLKKIDPDLKEIVDMTYFQDLSQKQIAEKTGLTQMQVSRKLKKALSKLYRMISKRKRA